MAKASRTRSKTPDALPPAVARFFRQLHEEPRSGVLVAVAVISAVGLYLSGIGYPLVFGDFAALQAAKLHAQATSPPSVGTTWLSDAMFGWSAVLFGERWPWHRALNIALHAVAVGFAFFFFRELCRAYDDRSTHRLAAGWVAFFAATLFALHPVAVYGVAYLSERASVLLGVFALIAFWAVARAVREGWRPAVVVAPLAALAALASSPQALGMIATMALIALYLESGTAPHRRITWIAVGGAAALGVVYATTMALTPVNPPADGQPVALLDSAVAASWRYVRYVGYWLAPVPAWLAIDIPEPPISAAAFRPGVAALMFTFALAIAVALGWRWRRLRTVRCLALAFGCALTMSLPALLWPRLAEPLSLSQSYPAMLFLCLVPAVLIAGLPLRAGFVAGGAAMLLALVLAGVELRTFASHSSVWDAAVRRVERFGAEPQDARVYVNRATVHRRAGHTIAALADYDKALALQPDHARALRGRAQVYVDEKRYADALRDLDRLLAVEPKQAITHADRGLVLLQAGRYAEAGAAFDRALERGVKEPRVYLNRGLARWKLSGLDGSVAALDDIEKALALDPRYALAHFNRGLIFADAANAGYRLRDAVSPEILRTIAVQNMLRSCELGYAPACARVKEKSMQDALPGSPSGPLQMTPEALRERGFPPLK